MKLRLPLFVALLIIFVVGALLFVFLSKNNAALPQPVTQFLATSSDTPVEDSQIDAVESTGELADIPFKELTIPYLRSLSYESELAELVTYETRAGYSSYLTSYMSDGLRVNGLLTIPAGQPPEGGWPAIVFVHGYIPPDSYRTTQKYEAYVDYLARNGFSVFKIDLRGHGDSEGQANGAYYSSEYVRDVLFAYNALGKQPSINPQRIGLWGHSMAGNVLLRALAVKPDIPAAAIWAGAVYSYTDWQKYGLSDHSFRLSDLQRADRVSKRQALFDTHGEFSPDSPFWKQVVATNYLSDLRGSIELHHAVDDAVVDVAYSRDLAPLLQQAGVNHRVFEYPSGGHNITGNSFSQAMSRTSEFFEDSLGS